MLFRSAYPVVFETELLSFYQRVSIASYASDGIARAEMYVCLSVGRSVCHTLVLYKNEQTSRFAGIGNFRPLSNRISERVQDRTKIAIGH